MTSDRPEPGTIKTAVTLPVTVTANQIATLAIAGHLLREDP